jgi:hypothetical protein
VRSPAIDFSRARFPAICLTIFVRFAFLLIELFFAIG